MSDSNLREPMDRLAERIEGSHTPAGAPSTLKSRIYSRLMLEQAQTGPLRSFTETRRAGFGLCPFEELVQIAPLGEGVKSRNICRVCHARVLGERVENAPIWWPNCPYVGFQNR